EAPVSPVTTSRAPASATPASAIPATATPATTTRMTAATRKANDMTNWIETLTGSLEQKKQYRECKARLKALPEPYREAAKAHDRYLLRLRPRRRNRRGHTVVHRLPPAGHPAHHDRLGNRVHLV